MGDLLKPTAYRTPKHNDIFNIAVKTTLNPLTIISNSMIITYRFAVSATMQDVIKSANENN